MKDRRLLWIVLAVLVVGVAALLLTPKVQETLGPQPSSALVAIEPEGSGVAEVGVVRLEAEAPFRLHAVMVAEDRDGNAVYYTEAPALRIGGEDVPAEALLQWSGRLEAKVRWFTVEGTVPYVELDPGQDLSRFKLTEIFRPQWPNAWSIPGRLEPANDDSFARQGARRDNPFGTQRYHVRIELFGRENRLVPEERFQSPGADAARDEPATFPTVIASLPGDLGPPSEVFGLTQIQPPAEGADPSLNQRLRELTGARLAFSQVTVLDAFLRGVDRNVETLTWTRVDLEAGTPWPEPGSLVRVGDRVVVLFEDAGEAGVLDRQDLCFDYALGAMVRPLSAVYSGGGEVELASVSIPTGQ